MYCKPWNPILTLLWNTLIVTAVFMALDYIYYGLISPGPDPYDKDLLNKIIFTILFALVFSHLYNKSSRMWRPNNNGDAFLFKQKVVASTDLCKISISKLANGIVFSLLISAVILLAMWLATFVASTIYVYLLDGIRSLPANAGDTGTIAGKVVIAGVALECIGKTDSDPVRGG